MSKKSSSWTTKMIGHMYLPIILFVWDHEQLNPKIGIEKEHFALTVRLIFSPKMNMIFNKAISFSPKFADEINTWRKFETFFFLKTSMGDSGADRKKCTHSFTYDADKVHGAWFTLLQMAVITFYGGTFIEIIFRYFTVFCFIHYKLQQLNERFRCE